MASGGGEKRAWMDDLKKEFTGANEELELAQWKKHSIYRVPAAVRELHPHAYRPQVVSLGPFHHGDEHLMPMEQHKRRAVRHLLRRTTKPLEEFVAAVEEVAPELRDAYQYLGDDWRGQRFLQVMVTDGCFLLEMMRTAEPGGSSGKDKASGAGGNADQNDPVFGQHGVLYMVPYVRRDMLIVENQLPLLLLEKLVSVERSNDAGPKVDVNKMVLNFISPSCKTPPPKDRGLHPLDVFRKSLLSTEEDEEEDASSIVRSATELYEAGIRFRKSETMSLHDVTFRCGVLSLPLIVVDDSTEYMYLNLMAFERLHAGAGNEVTAYVFFMDNIVDLPADVALLTSKEIIKNAVGSDKEVAKLFNGLAKDVALDPKSKLDDVQRSVNRYCRKPCHVWRANLVHTYFRSPWAILSLAAAVFLLAMTVLQTVYTVLSFYQGGNGCDSPLVAPAPR
ncbi:hypothetical protein GUJ93_ZPchr0009g872 [Zizania palustris]|uniref:Uncharacterized protein n=1 Tax=Zizania palustris TaxID=103762 RepID=A0A8J5RGL1_ZIZPA|nr:hypothetical protein GUJ93_ZPchr0009g872 [Zizania palustris]